MRRQQLVGQQLPTLDERQTIWVRCCRFIKLNWRHLIINRSYHDKRKKNLIQFPNFTWLLFALVSKLKSTFGANQIRNGRNKLSWNLNMSVCWKKKIYKHWSVCLLQLTTLIFRRLFVSIVQFLFLNTTDFWNTNIHYTPTRSSSCSLSLNRQ